MHGKYRALETLRTGSLASLDSQADGCMHASSEYAWNPCPSVLARQNVRSLLRNLDSSKSAHGSEPIVPTKSEIEQTDGCDLNYRGGMRCAPHY